MFGAMESWDAMSMFVSAGPSAANVVGPPSTGTIVMGTRFRPNVASYFSASLMLYAVPYSTIAQVWPVPSKAVPFRPYAVRMSDGAKPPPGPVPCSGGVWASGPAPLYTGTIALAEDTRRGFIPWISGTGGVALSRPVTPVMYPAMVDGTFTSVSGAWKMRPCGDWNCRSVMPKAALIWPAVPDTLT